jgi:hypothetical protein
MADLKPRIELSLDHGSIDGGVAGAASMRSSALATVSRTNK